MVLTAILQDMKENNTSWYVASAVFRKNCRDVVILHPQKDVHRKMRSTAVKLIIKGIGRGKKKKKIKKM